MKTRFFLLLLILLCFTACTHGGDNLFAFADADSAFTLTFASEAGDVTLFCTREGERVTAEITSPERSRGIKITVGGSSIILHADGADIPLSEEAALGLTSIFDVMFRGNEGALIRKSEDGEHTEIVYDDGVLTLDKEGLPIAADVGRTVKISNYVTKK